MVEQFHSRCDEITSEVEFGVSQLRKQLRREERPVLCIHYSTVGSEDTILVAQEAAKAHGVGNKVVYVIAICSLTQPICRIGIVSGASRLQLRPVHFLIERCSSR